MATGKTLEMRAVDTYHRIRLAAQIRGAAPRETRPRDRSLNGKARIQARRAAKRGA